MVVPTGKVSGANSDERLFSLSFCDFQSYSPKINENGLECGVSFLLKFPFLTAEKSSSFAKSRYFWRGQSRFSSKKSRHHCRKLGTFPIPLQYSALSTFRRLTCRWTQLRHLRARYTPVETMHAYSQAT